LLGHAAIENFFSSLKTERTAPKIYRTRNEARADVFDYVERSYNATERRCRCLASVAGTARYWLP